MNLQSQKPLKCMLLGFDQMVFDKHQEEVIEKTAMTSEDETVRKTALELSDLVIR